MRSADKSQARRDYFPSPGLTPAFEARVRAFLFCVASPAWSEKLLLPNPNSQPPPPSKNQKESKVLVNSFRVTILNRGREHPLDCCKFALSPLVDNAVNLREAPTRKPPGCLHSLVHQACTLELSLVVSPHMYHDCAKMHTPLTIQLKGCCGYDLRVGSPEKPSRLSQNAYIVLLV